MRPVDPINFIKQFKDSSDIVNLQIRNRKKTAEHYKILSRF